MRFRRLDRFTFNDTPRKRAGVLRSQARQRDALPLFAEQIASEQPSVDDVMAERAARSVRDEIERRRQRAADWRRARIWLARYPDDMRARLRGYWHRCGWPADPVYLLCMLNMHDTNRLDLEPVRSIRHG